MFKLIFFKELREIIQSSRFTISFAVCSTLIIVSFFMGAQNYLSSRAQYDAAIQENRNQIAANQDWSSIDHTIMLPPQPLMALVNGISNDVGRYIQVRSTGELNPQDTRFNDEPLFAVFRFMDLEFIFGVVLSLFAIIFAYDAINGERNRGTLKLCFSNALPRITFIFGKLLGSFVGLTVALLLPLLIGMVLLPVLGVDLNTDEWLRLLLIVVSGLLYFGVFLVLSIGISAVTKYPSSSFLISLVVWILAVFIIPKSSVLLAGRLVETPNVDEITAQKISYRTQLWEEDRPKLTDFRVPEGTPPEETFPKFSKFMDELGNIRQEKTDVFEERLSEGLQNKKQLQQKIALGIARISPASVFTIAVTELAGTSLDLQNRYLGAAHNYQQTYSQFMTEKTGQASSGGLRVMTLTRGADNNEEKKSLDPGELPAFEFKSPAFVYVLNRSANNIILLVLFNVIFLGFAFMAFLKYDLR